jgi:hypothetical protein
MKRTSNNLSLEYRAMGRRSFLITAFGACPVTSLATVSMQLAIGGSGADKGTTRPHGSVTGDRRVEEGK